MDKDKVRSEVPLFTTIYNLPTPPIELLINTVDVWCRKRVSGAMVYGVSGSGKSEAITFAEREAQRCFGNNCTTMRLNMDKGPRTKRQFFAKILFSLGFNVASWQDPETSKSKILTAIQGLVERTNARNLLFFIDDAHWLEYDEYCWLAGIYNELYKKGLPILVVLVGEPDLYDISAEYKANKGYEQIFNRFLKHKTEFSLLRSIRDLEYVLGSYDDEKLDPEESTTSITEDALPHSFSNGFRLKTLSPRVWNYYQQERNSSTTISEYGMTMKVCVEFVSSLLDELMPLDSKEMEVIDDHLKIALTDALEG